VVADVSGPGELSPVHPASAITHTAATSAGPGRDTLEVKHGAHFP
jgi:hypothetical protein